MAQVVIYTKDYCPYCTRAKALLARKAAAVTEYEVSDNPARFDEMVTRSGRFTVPQIFIDGCHVGGSDELAALERAGRLDALLSHGKSAA